MPLLYISLGNPHRLSHSHVKYEDLCHVQSPPWNMKYVKSPRNFGCHTGHPLHAGNVRSDHLAQDCHNGFTGLETTSNWFTRCQRKNYFQPLHQKMGSDLSWRRPVCCEPGQKCQKCQKFVVSSTSKWTKYQNVVPGEVYHGLCTQLMKLYDTRFSRGHSEPFVQSAVAAALTNWHQSNASECQFEQEPLWFNSITFTC